ncbi:MAG: DinB family protein [Pseudomonadota bacterium]
MSLTDRPYLAMALNNAWSNATLYRALSAVDDAAFAAPRPGFFGSLRATMNHIYAVDLYYVDALTEGGRGRAVFDREDTGSPSALATAQAEVDMAFAQFCGRADAQALQQVRMTERSARSFPERVDALILHLIQHQVHHRGQAHVQLQHAGIAPPQLDEFYLEFDRAPEAEVYWA